MLSLGRERVVLELAGDTRCSRALQGTGLVKPEGSNKVGATPRVQGNAIQRGQVGLEGDSGLGLWQSRTYSRVSVVLSAPVVGVGWVGSS